MYNLKFMISSRFTEREERPQAYRAEVIVDRDQRNSNFTFQQGDSEPTLKARPTNSSSGDNFMENDFNTLKNKI